VLTPESERKIAAALGVFSAHVDRQGLLSRLAVTRTERVTPLMFEQRLVERAKADRRHIVLPEGGDDRVLQAAEQGLGIALARELLAADALAEQRLVRLAPQSISLPGVYNNYHLVYPPHLHDWAPLAALRAWLHEEMERSRRSLPAR